MNAPKTLFHATAVVVITLAWATSSQATVIVDNPLDANRGGQFSNLGPSNQQVADEFVLTEAFTLDSVSWFGRYDAGTGGLPLSNPVSFSIRIFADNSGGPAIAPLEIRPVQSIMTLTGSTYSGGICATGGCPWISYSAALQSITLGPGTYWLSIVENDIGTAASGLTQWLWADTNTSGLRAIRNNDAQAWTTGTDINHAFALTGTAVASVPEPGTLILFGAGLLGLGIARRRSRMRV